MDDLHNKSERSRSEWRGLGERHDQQPDSANSRFSDSGGGRYDWQVHSHGAHDFNESDRGRYGELWRRFEDKFGFAGPSSLTSIHIVLHTGEPEIGRIHDMYPYIDRGTSDRRRSCDTIGRKHWPDHSRLHYGGSERYDG